eukprot:7959385-Pyramimonas_sp.AAC.1
MFGQGWGLCYGRVSATWTDGGRFDFFPCLSAERATLPGRGAPARCPWPMADQDFEDMVDDRA